MAKWPTWPAPGAARAAAGRSRKLHVWFDSEASSHASPAGAAGHALTGSSAHIVIYTPALRGARAGDRDSRRVTCAFAPVPGSTVFLRGLSPRSRVSRVRCAWVLYDI